MKILVATEDRDLLVSLLIFLREAAGIHVVGAAIDWESTAALVQSTHPDVVLLDETLWSGGSTGLADLLHGLDPQPSLIVLAAEIDEISEAAAVDAVALKHVSPESLLDSIKRVRHTEPKEK